MGIPGILAYRSICNSNVLIAVPDFRDKLIREKYRNDNWCTDPVIAGENLAPNCSFESPNIPYSVYDKVKDIWNRSIGIK